MSTCISARGEYGSHELDDAYTCTWCGVLDEEALVAELRRLRVTGREGICGDEAPSLFVNCAKTMPSICELRHGHASEWHEDGMGKRWKLARAQPVVDAPTLRLELHNVGAVFTQGHLTNTPSGAPYPLALAHDDWAALAAALDPATTARLFDQRDAAITERDQLRAEVKALKLVPRCGNTVDSVLSDTPHLVCDLPYGHPGTWHGCDQSYANGGLSTRAEWTERTAERSELEQALVEVERMRPVLEAAQALAAHRRTDADPADATDALLAAVDVYNQQPSPVGETEVK